MAITKLMTAEDSEQMAPDGFRYDLVRGELRRMSPAGYRHGQYVNRVNRVNGPMFAFAEAHDRGDVLAAETGFVLERDPDTVPAPDVSFVRKERRPPEDVAHRCAELPPDLAVDVVSPSDRSGDIEDKVASSMAAGVRLLWILYPERRRVRIHRSGRPPIDPGEDVLPGFRLPLQDIFR